MRSRPAFITAVCPLAFLTFALLAAPLARAQVGTSVGGNYDPANTGLVPIPGTGDIPAGPAAPPPVDKPSENLLIGATKATTWTDLDPRDAATGVTPAAAAEGTSVLQLEGPITLELDRNVMYADRAVLWLTNVKGKIVDHTQVDIALMGNVKLQQPEATRTGDELYVSVLVRGSVRVTAGQRATQNLSNSDLYKEALTLRPPRPQPATGPATEPTDPWVTTAAQTQPTSTPATTKPAPVTLPIAFSSKTLDSVKTPEGLVAIVLTGDVKVFQNRLMGEFLEMQAQRVVLFTTLHDLREAQRSDQFGRLEQAIQGAYLEGDVRIVHTPGAKPNITLDSSGNARRVHPNRPEQRIIANRVYYDFGTDRAILTQVVMHTADPKSQAPVVIRARLVRQLAMGEYRAEKVKLTQSSFATPSYAIGLDKAYIRQIDTGDVRYGSLTYYTGTNSTLDIMGVPFFYSPYASDEFSEHGSTFRGIETESSSRYGFSVETAFGFFETFGLIPPKETEITYNLDYFGKRGPAFNTQGKYAGGFVTENTKEPWSFEGDFRGFYVHDTGQDVLGRGRNLVTPPTENRGRIFLEHNHFLPDDWQLQLTVGYVSDRTFMPEWFEGEFNQSRPRETALYAKRQRDTEALTLLVSTHLNSFVTDADHLQEMFEVERYPEVGYRRIGESLLGDSLTLVSENTATGLHFKQDHGTLADYGFAPGRGPGLPSVGYTGLTDNVVGRGDFRQELAYPFTAGRFRVVPYVVGRYTVYSDSPAGGAQNRLLAGAGLRVLTDFWRVDDTIRSDFFDIHRLRHIIEPTLHVFTSGQTVAEKDLYIYDESVDAVHELTGVQLGLSQRWQTKRGGPTRWRSVDVFTLDVTANFFSKKPPDDLIVNSVLGQTNRDVTGTSGKVGDPKKFRGLFFDSEPEASISRNSVNADFVWRISDTTALFADAQYNLDYSKLATASIGFAVQRGQRLGYFLGTRYIAELDSNVTTFAANYELTPKYTLAFREAFEFGQRQLEQSSFSLIRHFDRLFVAVTLTYDVVAKQSGVGFSILPEGLGGRNNFSSSRLGTIFGQ